MDDGAELKDMAIQAGRNLTETGEILLRLTRDTEAEFLNTGSHLQEYALRAESISDKAGQVLNLLSEEEIFREIQNMQKVNSDISDYFYHTGKEGLSYLATLNNFSSILTRIDQLTSSFLAIVKLLRMLGISTRIESANLGTSDGGFRNLATEIKKLARLIEDRVYLISDKSEESSDLIAKILEETGETLTHQKEEGSRIMDQSALTITALNSLNQSSKIMAQEVFDKSARIQEDISEVVVSMQFHDITRQQIEHVISALDELAGEIKSGTADTDSEMVKHTGDVIHIQKAQLENSREEFVDSVIRIRSMLEDISQNTESLPTIFKSAGPDGENGLAGDLLTRLKEGVTDMIILLEKNNDSFRQLSGELISLAGSLDDMSVFLDDIHKISSDIELIALNSRVRASKTGKRGAPLGVLAGELQKLSRDSNIQTMTTTETIKKIVSMAQSFQQEVNSGRKEREQKVERLTSKLNSSISVLKEINMRFMSLMEDIRKECGALPEEIRRTARDIRIHEFADRELQTVIDTLQEIERTSRQIDPDSGLSWERVDKYKSRYSMEKERTIHRNLTREDLKINSKEMRADHVNESTESFGDNVELF